MIKLNKNPTLQELDEALRNIANGDAGDIENTQINAIKAMISLRLAQKRLSARDKGGIPPEFESI